MAFPKIKLPYSNRTLNLDFKFNERLDRVGSEIINDYFGISRTDPNRKNYGERGVGFIKSQITNYVQPSKYTVSISAPPTMDGTKTGALGKHIFKSDPATLKLIGAVCQSSTPPTKSFNSYTYELGTGTQTAPWQVSYGTVQMNFQNIIVDGHAVVFDFFHGWMNLIGDGNNFNYRNDYSGIVSITQFDPSGIALHTHKYTECYPMSVSTSELNYDATGAVQQVIVQFGFNIWERVTDTDGNDDPIIKYQQ